MNEANGCHEINSERKKQLNFVLAYSWLMLIILNLSEKNNENFVPLKVGQTMVQPHSFLTFTPVSFTAWQPLRSLCKTQKSHNHKPDGKGGIGGMRR